MYSLVKINDPGSRGEGRRAERSVKCSLPSGVAWRTRKSVLTPAIRVYESRATQLCGAGVSTASFKASINFLLTTKHTGQSDDLRVLLPTVRSTRRDLFARSDCEPHAGLFYIPLTPASTVLPPVSLLSPFPLLADSTILLSLVPIPTFEGHRHPRLETLYATPRLPRWTRGWGHAPCVN